MKERRNRSLRNCLPAVVNAIAGTRGVKVIWEGPPRTNGNTIWSNPIPLDADEDLLTVVVGDLDHECGHVLFTDFQLATQENLSGLRKDVVNAIEDAFIERRMGEKFFGAREKLAKSIEIAAKKGHVKTGKGSPKEALATFIDYWGRSNVVLQDTKELAAGARAHLVQYLEEKGVRRLEALLSTKMYSVDSTRGSIDLADQVIALIKDIRDEQENPSPGDGDQGDDAAGNNPGSGGEQPQDGGPTDGQQGSGTPTQGKSGARDILEDTSTEVGPAVDRKGAKEEMILEAIANGGQMAPSESAFTKPDRSVENLDRYNQIKASIPGQIAMLQRRLHNEFQALRRTRTKSSEEGRIDSRRLAYAVVGDPRVYKKRTEVQAPMPAVSVLIDCSGSMRGQEIMLALQATVAVSEVCNHLNIAHEVTVFGSAVGTVKGFDEPLVRSRGRLGAIDAGGGTPMTEALWIAGRRLVSRKESRKIMLVVSDGAPNNTDTARDLVSMAERDGVEAYGIGIGNAGAAIRDVCTKAGVVASASNLAEAILAALAERMLRKAA